MVKLTLAVVISLMLGLAFGVAAKSWEFRSAGDHFVASLNAEKLAVAEAPGDELKGGKVTVVNGESHDFGVMDRSETGRHTFKIKNEGHGPLSITLLQTTCTCTSSDLEEGEPVTLGPGEIKDVTLEWDVEKSSQSFSQSATLATSDPGRHVMRLTVKGRIDSLFNLYPETIVFADLSNKKSATRSLRVYSYKHEDLACEHVRQLSPDLEKFFSFDVSALSAEEVAEVEDAKSGLLVRVTAQPGLSLGPFRQQASLITNVENNTTIKFDIEGNVVGDIKVWTREKYSERNQVLELGLIKHGQQRKAELQIFVKGEHKDTKVTLDPNAIEPSEVMKATLGAPIAMGKNARRFPLLVEVDAGDRTISRLARAGEDNYGKIVIKTTHPEAPEIVIRVSFATGG